MTGRLLDLGETVGFVVPRDAARNLAQRLLMYRFRAKVDITVAEEVSVAVACPAAAAAAVGLCAERDWLETQATGDLLAVTLGSGITEVYAAGPTGSATLEGLATIDEDDWRRQRIAAGLVDVDERNADRFTPHMLSLERAGAISFSKGCYTGQEIVARTEHRGRVKRRLAAYRFAGDAAVAAGDKLLLNEREVGEVAVAAKQALLAVVADEARDQVLTVSAMAIDPIPLPWELSERDG